MGPYRVTGGPVLPHFVLRSSLACVLPLFNRQVLLDQELGPLLREAEAAVRVDVA